MSTKRNAVQAFGLKSTGAKSNGAAKPQLSAFAAARAGTTHISPKPEVRAGTQKQDDTSIVRSKTVNERQRLVSSIAISPYDGHHSSRASPDVLSESENEFQPATPARPTVQLSTLNRKGGIVRDDENGLELSLRPEESVVMLGGFDLEVLTGVVTIYGAMLHPNRGVQRVFAPSISPLPAIVSRKPNTAIRITSTSSSLQTMERLSPLFRNIGAKDKVFHRSFTLLHNTGDDELNRALTPLEVDEGTRKVISQLNARLESGGPAPKIMAIGPKSSGKSTFNRILCNTITSRAGNARCLYLDLDPGQPEFGPPGQIALVEVANPILGPPFTHLAAPRNASFSLLRSHTIAATSFKDDPDHYVACAVDLFRHAPKNVPVVINSCGWASGIGARTIVSLVSKLSITDPVILEPLDTDLALEIAGTSGSTALRIPRRQRQQGLRTPAELRAMQTMAYFHSKANATKWLSRPISEIRPWIVSYDTEVAGISAVLNYGQSPHPDFLGEVLDGSVVALVVIDDDVLDPSTIERTSAEYIPYLPISATGHTPPIDPRRSSCAGLALVRGIDIETRSFHLVTPLAESDIAGLMHKRVVLVRGGFDSPDWAYLEDLYAAKEGAVDDVEERPWVSKKEQVGIEGSVWRLRHPPMAKDVR